MHVKTTNGAEVEISHEEAMRIAHMMHQKDPASKNDAYHQKAHKHLEEALGMSFEDKEDAIKKAMYEGLDGWSKKDVEVVFEMAEWIASCHYMKMTSED